MRKEFMLKKKPKNASWRNLTFQTCLIISMVASAFMVTGCSSKPAVKPKKPLKATHGSVFKVDDYSQECTWQLIVGKTKKRCVRK